MRKKKKEDDTNESSTSMTVSKTMVFVYGTFILVAFIFRLDSLLLSELL